jgi:uncharacterized protein YoxC
MRKRLIAATIGEVVLLVAVLAGYLIAIANTLRRVSATLGKITFGVRAIDTQTQPLGSRLREVNEALEQLAERLAAAAPAEGVERRQ